MTDNTEEPTPPADDAPESEWKAYARIWEQRAKANAKRPDISDADLADLRDKAGKLDKAEADALSDLEKANKRATDAEEALAKRDAKEASAKLLADIATAKGVPASALRGSTKEELEAHADELKALLPEVPIIPNADGQGDQGQQIGDGQMTPQEIVNAAVGK